MHNNYFFIRQLSHYLQQKIVGSQVTDVFTQQKEELIFEFTKPTETIFLKAALKADFSVVTILPEFYKTSKNRQPRFKSILNSKVIAVNQHLNERSFSVQLTSGLEIIFKLFGNRGNVLLFENGCVTEVLKPSLKNDYEIEVALLNRKIDFSEQHFLASDLPLDKLYPTLGPLPIQLLQEQGFFTIPKVEQWYMLQALFERLNKPSTYHLTSIQGKMHLSLVPIGEIMSTYNDPILALNQFAFEHEKKAHFINLKNNALAQQLADLKMVERSLEKITNYLEESKKQTPFSQQADVLMANLHAIPQGAEEITLHNFYDNSSLSFTFKLSESPQKKAEKLYRKAKYEILQIENGHHKKAALISQRQQIITKINSIERANHASELKQFIKEEKKEKALTKVSPYKQYKAYGFTILVGRNAKNSEQLTQTAHKDDIWLHARNAAGAHVVIKQQTGKPVPEPVLEVAAQLAAFNSKKKSEKHCPVIVTQKKWVRKRKGGAVGEVIVEKEKVRMVTPADFQKLNINNTTK